MEAAPFPTVRAWQGGRRLDTRWQFRRTWRRVRPRVVSAWSVRRYRSAINISGADSRRDSHPHTRCSMKDSSGYFSSIILFQMWSFLRRLCVHQWCVSLSVCVFIVCVLCGKQSHNGFMLKMCSLLCITHAPFPLLEESMYTEKSLNLIFREFLICMNILGKTF